MNERSKAISKLLQDKKARWSYIKAKIGVRVPSQIRALRLKSNMPRQLDLAKEAEMQQSRISMFETPGAANVTLETLAWLAAVYKVGLSVNFVPFSQMLDEENTFSQDDFNVLRLDEDQAFLNPTAFPPTTDIGVHISDSFNSFNFERQNPEGGATKYHTPRELPSYNLTREVAGAAAAGQSI